MTAEFTAKLGANIYAAARRQRINDGPLQVWRRKARPIDFNHRRLLEPIGHIPPAEAEERYYGMLDAPAMAA